MKFPKITLRDDMDPELAAEVLLRTICEHAGARYVGVQKAVPELGVKHSLLMFIAPGCGSTCALRIGSGYETISTEAIRAVVAAKEALFAQARNN